MLVFAGATDGIAPIAAVRPVLDLLSGAREVRFEIVPGGHLGMLTGRAARGTTWRVLDEWIEQWSSDDVPPTPRRTTKKAAASKKAAAKTSKKAAPKKPPAVRKTTTRRAPAKKATPQATPSPDAIGANPARRYGSGGSRALRS